MMELCVCQKTLEVLYQKVWRVKSSEYEVDQKMFFEMTFSNTWIKLKVSELSMRRKCSN